MSSPFVRPESNDLVLRKMLSTSKKVKSEALRPRLAYAAGAYPGFRSMKQLGVFLLPLDGMLVHRRSLPRNFVRFPQQFAGTHLYSWVERGTVRVKCPAQEHNTVSPARARTRTAGYEGEAGYASQVCEFDT